MNRRHFIAALPFASAALMALNSQKPSPIRVVDVDHKNGIITIDTFSDKLYGQPWYAHDGHISGTYHGFVRP